MENAHLPISALSAAQRNATQQPRRRRRTKKKRIMPEGQYLIIFHPTAQRRGKFLFFYFSLALSFIFFHFLSFSLIRRRRRATLFFFPTFILSLSNLFEKYAPAFTPPFLYSSSSSLREIYFNDNDDVASGGGGGGGGAPTNGKPNLINKGLARINLQSCAPLCSRRSVRFSFLFSSLLSFRLVSPSWCEPIVE